MVNKKRNEIVKYKGMVHQEIGGKIWSCRMSK